MTQLKVRDYRTWTGKGLANQELAEWLGENNIVSNWVVADQPEGLPKWEAGQLTALMFDFDQDGQKILMRNPLTGQVKVNGESDMVLKTHVETLPCPKAPPVSLHVS